MWGYFTFVRVWAGERDLVTILVSTISFLMYISVVMDYVTIQCAGLFYVCKGLGGGTRSHSPAQTLTNIK